jgi:hypothetical protein
MNWPTGKDGSLVIRRGQTYTVTPSAILDFDLIIVEPNGTLEVSSGGDWVVLVCSSDAKIDGVIRVTEGDHSGGTFRKDLSIAPVSLAGLVLEYTIVQKLGGNGGPAMGGMIQPG